MDRRIRTSIVGFFLGRVIPFLEGSGWEDGKWWKMCELLKSRKHDIVLWFLRDSNEKCSWHLMTAPTDWTMIFHGIYWDSMVTGDFSLWFNDTKNGGIMGWRRDRSNWFLHGEQIGSKTTSFIEVLMKICWRILWFNGGWVGMSWASWRFRDELGEAFRHPGVLENHVWTHRKLLCNWTEKGIWWNS